MTPAILQRQDLVHPELCYKIVGVLLNVYGKLGYGLREQAYEKAAALAFKKEGLTFVEQLYAPIMFEGEVVEKNYLDFLVEGKVVVELKRGDKFVKNHIDQVHNYLSNNKLQLGILAYFAPQRLHYKRIVNIT
jgi:GxxExxY protein